MPTPAGAKRHYARAIEALNEAEALAKLSDVVGPADVPPEPGSEKAFLDDWQARAKGVLRKGYEWVQSGKAGLKDRARRAAQKVRQGVREIYEASPAAKAGRALESVSSAANSLQWAALATTGLATAVLLYLAWKLLIERK